MEDCPWMQLLEAESLNSLSLKGRVRILLPSDWALFFLLWLLPFFLILSIWSSWIARTSHLLKQERVTHNRPSKIWKFRTMVHDADKKEAPVDLVNDSRITKVGNFIRRVRLDEPAQLVNVLKGEMSFVGTRPEVPLHRVRSGARKTNQDSLCLALSR